MKTSLRPLVLGVQLALMSAAANAAVAIGDLYVPLDQPCRLLDTRIGSVGPLSSSGGNYLFGTSLSDISGAYQKGNPAGCGIPAGVDAVATNFNILNATAPGNIRAWSTSAGPVGPLAGSSVFSETAATPGPGLVFYNAGFSDIAVNPADGKFYLSVANGQIDMTINVTGYWVPLGFANGSAAGQVYLTGSSAPFAPQNPQTVTGDVTLSSAAVAAISNNPTAGNNIVTALGSATGGTIPASRLGTSSGSPDTYLNGSGVFSAPPLQTFEFNASFAGIQVSQPLFFSPLDTRGGNNGLTALDALGPFAVVPMDCAISALYVGIKTFVVGSAPKAISSIQLYVNGSATPIACGTATGTLAGSTGSCHWPVVAQQLPLAVSPGDTISLNLTDSDPTAARFYTTTLKCR